VVVHDPGESAQIDARIRAWLASRGAAGVTSAPGPDAPLPHLRPDRAGEGAIGSVLADGVRRSVMAAIDGVVLKEALLGALVAAGHVSGPADRRWSAMTPQHAAELLLASGTAGDADGRGRAGHGLQVAALLPLLRRLRESGARPPFDPHAVAKATLLAPLVARGTVCKHGSPRRCRAHRHRHRRWRRWRRSVPV
jgi:hypothetical protein